MSLVGGPQPGGECDAGLAKVNIPDLSAVDYDQPLQMIRSAQVRPLSPN